MSGVDCGPRAIPCHCCEQKNESAVLKSSVGRMNTTVEMRYRLQRLRCSVSVYFIAQLTKCKWKCCAEAAAVACVQEQWTFESEFLTAPCLQCSDIHIQITLVTDAPCNSWLSIQHTSLAAITAAHITRHTSQHQPTNNIHFALPKLLITSPVAFNKTQSIAYAKCPAAIENRQLISSRYVFNHRLRRSKIR